MTWTVLKRLVAVPAAAGALLCGAGAVAGWAGALHPRLDLVAQFEPLLGVGAAAALVLLRLTLHAGRLRRALSAVASVGVIAATAVCGPELWAGWTAPRAAADGAALRVLQYNLYAANGDPERSATVASAAAPDVAVLQEVVWRGAEVQQALRPALPYGASAGLRGRARILSRRPGRHDVIREDGLEVARLRTTLADGRPVTVLGVHFVWPEPLFPQAQQRRALERVVERHAGETLVLAGDMNLTPWSAAMRQQDRRLERLGLTRRTRALPSWPASVTRRRLIVPAPLLPIDHVYASQDLRTVEVRRLPRTGSDHYPVLVVLAPEEAGAEGALRPRPPRP